MLKSEIYFLVFSGWHTFGAKPCGLGVETPTFLGRKYGSFGWEVWGMGMLFFETKKEITWHCSQVISFWVVMEIIYLFRNFIEWQMLSACIRKSRLGLRGEYTYPVSIISCLLSGEVKV